MFDQAHIEQLIAENNFDELYALADQGIYYREMTESEYTSRIHIVLFTNDILAKESNDTKLRCYYAECLLFYKPECLNGCLFIIYILSASLSRILKLFRKHGLTDDLIFNRRTTLDLNFPTAMDEFAAKTMVNYLNSYRNDLDGFMASEDIIQICMSDLPKIKHINIDADLSQFIQLLVFVYRWDNKKGQLIRVCSNLIDCGFEQLAAHILKEMYKLDTIGMNNILFRGDMNENVIRILLNYQLIKNMHGVDCGASFHKVVKYHNDYISEFKAMRLFLPEISHVISEYIDYPPYELTRPEIPVKRKECDAPLFASVKSFLKCVARRICSAIRSVP
jgi:hypothetical protein